MKRGRERGREEEGAAAVEMAFLLPFLLLVVFGIVELGHALNVHMGLQEAAGEGAIYIAYNPGDGSGARDRVVDAVTSPVLTLGEVSVTCPAASTAVVTVTHDHDLFTPIVSTLLGGTINMQVVATEQVLSTTVACSASP